MRFEFESGAKGERCWATSPCGKAFAALRRWRAKPQKLLALSPYVLPIYLFFEVSDLKINKNSIL